MIDYIKSFKSVDNNKILIKNRDEVNAKIQKFINGGQKSLAVISDYDLTITKQHINGKRQFHLFDVLKHCPSVPLETKKMYTDISQKYRPLDKDITISESKRTILMEEWWNKAIDAYKGLKISQEEMLHTIKEIGPPIRDNAKNFFANLAKSDVPVLIISAGIGDFLELLLRDYGIASSNIEVLSNYIELDSEGRIIGYQSTPIHTRNKNKIGLENTKFLEKTKDRHNVLVMGDHLGDASMADQLKNVENILKIGFFYGEAESVLPTWLETFDIVLKDDQTMNVPIALLELLK